MKQDMSELQKKLYKLSCDLARDFPDDMAAVDEAISELSNLKQADERLREVEKALDDVNYSGYYECGIIALKKELDAARRDVDALRQRSLVSSRVADGRLKEIERLRDALEDVLSINNNNIPRIKAIVREALAAQQEKKI